MLWLIGLSFPENHTQFADLLNENKDVMPLSQSREYTNRDYQNTTNNT